MNAYQVFQQQEGGHRAVKRGFSWPAFFLSWIWAFSRGLWFEAFGILAAALVACLLALGLAQIAVPLRLIPALVFCAWCGWKGNFWMGRKLENSGWTLMGTIMARDRQDAVAKVAAVNGVIPAEMLAKPSAAGFIPIPRSLQGIVAIIGLTWKAAFRYRLFWVVLGLLLMAVIGLPLLVKHDGTAEGFAQILITYTLGAVTVLLGLCTLWLACGTLARDVEECQMQVVAVKPIPRWQIWLGKWLGLVALNALLLAAAGLSTYCFLEWRGRSLSPGELFKLRTQVLVARGSSREQGSQEKINKEVEARFREQMAKASLPAAQAAELRQRIDDQVHAEQQSVSPGRDRVWQLHLNIPKSQLKGEPLYLRVKFNAAASVPYAVYSTGWMAGDPKGDRVWQAGVQDFTPDAFHEFPIPSEVVDDQGNFLVRFVNPSPVTLLFPLEDGLEVLYRVGSFGLNLVRGLGIILCWMALLAALGLAAASLLSFPVAAFCSLAILSIGLSSGTLSTVVSEGTVLGVNSETGQPKAESLDWVMMPVFREMLRVINLVQEFSPVDSLSTGRDISWEELGRAAIQVVVLLGGILALFGMVVFQRRELATAQGTH